MKRRRQRKAGPRSSWRVDSSWVELLTLADQFERYLADGLPRGFVGDLHAAVSLSRSDVDQSREVLGVRMELASDADDSPPDVDDVLHHVGEVRPDKAMKLCGVDPGGNDEDVRCLFRHGEIEALRAKLRQLQRERDDIEEQVRRDYPNLAALGFPQPLDLRAVQLWAWVPGAPGIVAGFDRVTVDQPEPGSKSTDVESIFSPATS
ncbi:MAG: hypothetical protein GY719_11195 [bacterium]|nr:hypothetical protein [bacterium]